MVDSVDYNNIKDVSECSSGEDEVFDLAFMLSVIHHLGIGKDYPVILDEIDSKLSEDHRFKIPTLIEQLVHRGTVSQLFIINHHASVFTAFKDYQVICPSSKGINPPPNTNVGVTIEH